MLIKSSSRGTSQADVDRLGRHLVAKDNQEVVFLEGCEDATSLSFVLSEMRAITMATREVKRYVTRTMVVSGHQTPRAILSAPQSFRIRHVQKPTGPAAMSLADLKLKNRDAYLEGVETGPIRSLDGFSTAKNHTVPKTASAGVDAWVERLMQSDLQAELDEMRTRAKSALGITRRETNVQWADGGGSLDTTAFRYTILCDQDPENPANYRVRRQLELRDGWQDQRDAIDKMFEDTALPCLVVEIEPAPRAFDSIAETLDDLATRTGASLQERSAEKCLTYSDQKVMLVVDLQSGRVELSFSEADGLAVLEHAYGYNLGWRAASPMLPPPMPESRKTTKLKTNTR